MVAISTLVRKTPVQALRRYFASRDIALDDFDWELSNGALIKPVLAAIDALDETIRSPLIAETQRVGAMADEIGQTAIYSVASDKASLDGLANGYERAFSLLVNNPSEFRRAEEIRYTDERRRGRLWTGFLGEENATLRRDDNAIEAFKEAVRARFQSGNVHVDVFDRVRAKFDDDDILLIQATVYSEGRREEYFEFVDGQLDTRGRKPVIEAAMTYEPKTGVIEVVAKDRETREEYARILSRELLGVDFEDEHVPMRRYELAALLRPHAFPTDAEDKIENVRVASLRLMPLDDNGQRVTLECTRKDAGTIWSMAEKRFADLNPLLGGWIVTQARLAIKFLGEPGSSRGKTLPVTITMPTGCDLKDRTERERMVGEKYLKRWQLVEEV